MTKPRNYQTEAIIIKKTKLGEADTILTLYTPHLGKIQGFAKSLRKTKSKMAGHLELLTHSLVSLVRGRNIDTITGSQTIDSYLPLKADLWLASCALYTAELVDQFAAENQENYPLFQLLQETMQRLCQGDGELGRRACAHWIPLFRRRHINDVQAAKRYILLVQRVRVGNLSHEG